MAVGGIGYKEIGVVASVRGVNSYQKAMGKSPRPLRLQVAAFLTLPAR